MAAQALFVTVHELFKLIDHQIRLQDPAAFIVFAQPQRTPVSRKQCGFKTESSGWPDIFEHIVTHVQGLLRPYAVNFCQFIQDLLKQRD